MKIYGAPAQIRSIFGENLKTLYRETGAVAAICRELDINRTQFNRYLSGESFPRPDILAKICDRFSVDAHFTGTAFRSGQNGYGRYFGNRTGRLFRPAPFGCSAR